MPAPDEEQHGVLGLIVEYFDPQPQLIRQYVLKYFLKHQEVEMVDRKSRRLFLKRTTCPGHVGPNDLFVGNKVNLFGRNMTVVDYADPYTKSMLQPVQQRGLFVVTPDAFYVVGKLLDSVLGAEGAQDKLQLGKIRLVRLTELQAEEAAKVLGGEGAGRALASTLAKGPLVACLVSGDNATERLKKIGASQRALYAAGESEPAFLVAESEEQIGAWGRLLLDNPKLQGTATFDSCTCCVIRPHAIKAGAVGKIVDMINSQGYEVSAMRSFSLDLASAKEFLEVYKGVVPEYTDMAEELTEGPVVALEVRAEDAVATFRQTAGPWDVEIAKELRPATIRAKFGIDRIRNGIHCSDLPEDGELECRYFFELLASSA